MIWGDFNYFYHSSAGWENVEKNWRLGTIFGLDWLYASHREKTFESSIGIRLKYDVSGFPADWNLVKTWLDFSVNPHRNYRACKQFFPDFSICVEMICSTAHINFWKLEYPNINRRQDCDSVRYLKHHTFRRSWLVFTEFTCDVLHFFIYNFRIVCCLATVVLVSAHEGNNLQLTGSSIYSLVCNRVGIASKSIFVTQKLISISNKFSLLSHIKTLPFSRLLKRQSNMFS